MKWIMLHPKMTMDHLGWIPSFLSENDPRSAKEQINANYGHGGGWRPSKNFTKVGYHVLQYPGDPPLKPLAQTKLRNELILYYQHSFVCIVQPDESWEVARVD